MIYRLEIENFYSFRDPQVIDLVIARSVPDNSERFSPIYAGANIRAPKVIALFGANASGKSTVLKALAFIAWVLKDSFAHTAPGLPCEAFNDEASANRPIRLAVEFGGPVELTKAAMVSATSGSHAAEGTYRYELELATKDWSVTAIRRECLRQRKSGQGKWLRVFERQDGGKLTGSKSFPLAGFAQVVDKIRPDASVVSTLALFEHEVSKTLVAAANSVFSNTLIDETEPRDDQVIMYLANNPSVVDELSKQLQRIDVGVKEMVLEQTPQGPTPFFLHEGLKVKMPWSLESYGTRTFIRIFPWLSAALAKGGVAIIDELDVSIHPLILPEIVRWFYSTERNPMNAQLWLTCHSAPLMEELSKEEIVICEKDRKGRSQVYSLMDVKSVRRSENLYRKYMGGVYGGVPHIG